jgi:hypothetical protein
MTQKFYNQFVSQYLKQLLSPLGSVEVRQQITDGDRRGIILFFPGLTTQIQIQNLGLVAKITQTDCSIEVHSEQVDEAEVLTCIHKLFAVFSDLQCQTKRESKTLDEENLPYLWILSPSTSENLLKGIGAKLDLENWPAGVYFLPNAFRTAIVAVNQLPVTTETLWLRILGRGETQRQAVTELLALPESNPLRQNTLRLITNWCIVLVQQQDNLTEDEQELVMNLSQAYQQWEETTKQQGVQEGVQQERRQVVENLLRFRFGSVDEELTRVVDSLLQLPPEEFTPLCLQLPREELLNRF